MKSNQKPTTYTIDYQLVGDHLQVTIPELGIVLETAPGKIKRDDATSVAMSAIAKWLHEHEQVKASELKALDVHQNE
jgi:hypothetical protein